MANPQPAVDTWVEEHKSIARDFLKLYRRCEALAQKTSDNGFYGDSTLSEGSDVTLNEVRLAHNLLVLDMKTMASGSAVGNADRLGTAYRLLRSDGA